MTENNGEIGLGGIRTFKDLLNSPQIKKLNQFIPKRALKKFDRQGLIPCYTINNRKGYKVGEVMKWVKDELTNKHDGVKIISRFNVLKVKLDNATNVPIELTDHGDDLYEYNTYLPPCVYFLIDKSQIVYVGQSANLPARLHAHRMEKNFDRALYMPIDNGRLAEIERFFIETLTPKYNRENFMVHKSYRFKDLGYKFINKILYKEHKNGLLEKHI